jgi:hypothetical protein
MTNGGTVIRTKIVSCVLVATLSFSMGCYSNQTMTREQLTPTAKEELKSNVEERDVTVLTKDFSKYKFLKGDYRIQGDTLKGFGVRIIGGDDRPFDGSISFADIAALETEEFDLTATLIAIGLPVGLVVGFLFALAAGMSRI